MTRTTRMAVAAGTVVVLTGLALTFQVLRFEFGAPARAGTQADATAPALAPLAGEQDVPPSVTDLSLGPSRAPAPAAPPEPPTPTHAVRLSPPAPAEPPPPEPTPVARDPQTTLLQPVPAVPGAPPPEPPRQVTVARWPLAAPVLHEPPQAEPQDGSWARPQALDPAAAPPVADAARPAPAMPPRGAEALQPMPAAAAAPRHRPAAHAAALPFTGTHPCLLGDNGALQLPADVRRQLEPAARRTLFVTPGPDQSLWLFTGPSLERWAEDLDRAGSSRGRDARRLCLAQTEACVLDRAGRTHLPEHLAQFAGLCQDVVLLGVGDHLELWDAPRWQQHRERQGNGTPRADEDGER